MANEQGYEKFRAKLRSLELRVTQLEAANGVNGSRPTQSVPPNRMRVPLPTTAKPSVVNVRRNPGRPLPHDPNAAPVATPAPAPAASVLAAAGLDPNSLVELLGAALSDAAGKLVAGLTHSIESGARTPPAPAAQPPASGDPSHELAWLEAEGGAAPPPTAEH